jgi:hypothetical protein
MLFFGSYRLDVQFWPSRDSRLEVKQPLQKDLLGIRMVAAYPKDSTRAMEGLKMAIILSLRFLVVANKVWKVKDSKNHPIKETKMLFQPLLSSSFTSKPHERRSRKIIHQSNYLSPSNNSIHPKNAHCDNGPYFCMTLKKHLHEKILRRKKIDSKDGQNYIGVHTQDVELKISHSNTVVYRTQYKYRVANSQKSS